MLDGEVCALDSDGHAKFGLLQRGTGSLVIYLFDILELDGEDLTRPPARRAAGPVLEQTLVPNDPVVRLSVAFDDGPALLDQVRALGMEGIVSKRAAEPLSTREARRGVGQGEDARPPGVRDRRLHARQGPPVEGHRRAHPGRASATATSSTSGTAARGSTTRSSTACRICSTRSGATPARSWRCRACRGCGRPT